MGTGMRTVVVDCGATKADWLCSDGTQVRTSGFNLAHTPADQLQSILEAAARELPDIDKLYLYAAIAPVPLSTFAGEPSQNVGRSFLKSYAAVCLEGAIIVLACIIFSVFAATPPTINTSAAPVTMVWSYIAELVFNMLVLVGAVKMADRVVREMMGL